MIFFLNKSITADLYEIMIVLKIYLDKLTVAWTFDMNR